MSVARARRYPQPPPAGNVLGAERCDHGEITGRCALCRVAAQHADDKVEDARQAEARPVATTPQPDRAPVVDEDDQNPGNVQ